MGPLDSEARGEGEAEGEDEDEVNVRKRAQGGPYIQSCFSHALEASNPGLKDQQSKECEVLTATTCSGSRGVRFWSLDGASPGIDRVYRQ